MINVSQLQKTLCETFCSTVSVNAVPCGYAVSSFFTDRSGDRIGFYIVEDEEEYRIEDDGEYLSRLIAMGIDIEKGARGQLLDAILDSASAYWDRDTFEIRTKAFAQEALPKNAVNFISALIRVRDLELLTREVVRSTFRSDAAAAIIEKFGRVANIDEGKAIDSELAEFPTDMIIRPTEGKAAAVYFANTEDKLSEALLLQYEAEKHNRTDFSVIALIEDPEMSHISKKKFQRAQNRSLTMPIFRGDETAALSVIERKMSNKG